MLRLKVYEASADSAEIALLDAEGRCYIARTLSQPPAVGTMLAGRALHLGRCIVVSDPGRRRYRIDVIEIDCDRQRAIERLHPFVTTL
ncbi:MAG: hypothetical protein KGL18_02280 [Burkholderiales bacterium]|nr:hypothetical protein [Burkholderiales bacterium]MDE1926639.1 hypothetical protein [Burkholderiales bacterium]MDE2159028.1 hypothetical protein [Burkholderiales bacterium]MDE2501795.1 hypothetical protein [Burkholderiales bacterium]